MVKQEIKSYGFMNGAKSNFLKYGYELKAKQKNGWYIKYITDIDSETISVVWEKIVEDVI
jgi:hypothetical protein